MNTSCRGDIVTVETPAFSEIRALESKFFDAFERGDVHAIAECYAPDMRVWNSLPQAETSGAEHIAMLTESFPSFSNRKFSEVRTDRFATGFVRQHVITGVMNGEPVRILMCVVCHVSNGKMTRLDEYLTFSKPPAERSC